NRVVHLLALVDDPDRRHAGCDGVRQREAVVGERDRHLRGGRRRCQWPRRRGEPPVRHAPRRGLAWRPTSGEATSTPPRGWDEGRGKHLRYGPGPDRASRSRIAGHSAATMLYITVSRMVPSRRRIW